ncbi:MAG: recombinase family protein [Candidatus Marinimicrobia bacterium]|nr:recombinase family protein [Candidatus Neomarinimicrobiota bacterium]
MMQATVNGQIDSKVRCAIYTRKSTEDGLEQDYNTLDAQWDSCENYIKSQASRGWEVIPTHYDDGGFTGANTERPSFNRLITDVKTGLIDTVIVYKVDRLSRSLADFANMMELFDKHKVAFVSVTQYFDTSSSIGRMTLNILITFAQFEREMISERIRDKISSSRQKGKYMGGQRVLGYDVVEKKLVINENEKYQIQKIYDFYLNNRSINEIVDTINNWGWTTKQWKTKPGHLAGGKPFSKSLLYTILKNPLYIGKIRHHNKIYDGEHEGIISQEIYDKVQLLMKKNKVNQTNTNRKRIASMLRGILFCSSCGSKMIKTYTKTKIKKYTYYTCLNAIKNGKNKCVNKSVPSAKLDEFVVNHIREIASNPEFLNGFIEAFSKQKELDLVNIKTELKTLTVKLASYQIERDRMALDNNLTHIEALTRTNEQLEKVTNRIKYLETKRNILMNTDLNAGEVTVTLNKFFPIWDTLTLNEQNRILDKLFNQIIWDGKSENLDFHYSPLGIKLLENEQEDNHDPITVS